MTFHPLQAVIRRAAALRPAWLQASGPLNIPNDLTVTQSGCDIHNDQMNYLWFELTECEAGRSYPGFRVVRLLQLKFIPLEARADAGLLQKQRSVLRGLHSSRVNPVYLAAGIQDPPLGIIQCYGVSTFAGTQDEAVNRSLQDLATLEANLKGVYRQIRLAPLSGSIAAWIYKSLDRMPHALVAVGHPDPRENSRGGDRGLRNPLLEADAAGAQYSQQQNELLYRGMSNLQEEFLLIVMAHHLPIAQVIRLLAGNAEETSIWASKQQGIRSASFGISLPAFLSGGLADSASQNYGLSTAEATSEGSAHTDGLATSAGSAHMVGQAESAGWSHVVTRGTAISDSVATTVGQSITEGTAHTQGQAVSDSVTETSGSTGGHTSTTGSADAIGVGVNVGSEIGGDIGINAGVDAGLSGGISSGVSSSYGHTWSASEAESSGWMQSTANSHGVTASAADTTARSITSSSATTTGHSETISESEAVGSSGSVTNSVADTTSTSTSQSAADTTSASATTSRGQTLGLGLGRSISNALSVGVAPSFSIGNSAQWQNDPAMLVAELMRVQQQLLKQASVEGAYYTDVYALAKTQRGLQGLMGLIPQSFQGTQEVVTGVQCRTLTEQEQAYIRLHAQAFTPSTREEHIPGALTGYADSTILTLLQLSAYTAPGVFEQGTAVTTQEETPPFAFYPAMPGGALLGMQYSTEIGELTETPLLLARDRHFHTAFIGDTGFGKSVAAERLAYETTLKWGYRTIVLDFGQGWRRALAWPGFPPQRVEVYQLAPGARCPLRWNFLQVPRRYDPGTYRSVVAELLANAGRMGPRQLGFIRRALTQVYLRAGVLIDPTDEQAPKEHGQPWDRVLPDEAQVIGCSRDTAVIDLTAEQRQLLAVERSRWVSVRSLVNQLKGFYGGLGKADQSSRTALEGVLLRLEPLAEEAMLRQYGPGEDGLPVEDLGLLGPPGDPWGMTVIEGGAEMDEYTKAALFSLLAAVLYQDAVKRRREMLAGSRFPPLQIFFEEANKVLTGVTSGSAADTDSRGNVTSSAWQSMWRDGRKYNIFLHLMAQTASELPTGILSSCANVFVFQTKNPHDRDQVLPHLGRSEKGIVNTEYKRYLARIPRAYAIVKLGYSGDVTDIEPVLIQPKYVPGNEPGDEILYQRMRMRAEARIRPD